MNFHFSKELQWFRGGHGLFSSSESSFLQGITMNIVTKNIARRTVDKMEIARRTVAQIILRVEQ